MAVTAPTKRVRIVAIAVIVVCVALVAVCAWYVSDYYHAEDVHNALASDAQVQVSAIPDGWLFDGPGAESAFVFYPGAKVEATAYAPLMHELAERGMDCFLVQMPFNLAFFGINKVQGLVDDPAYATYSQWYLGGHSLGGAMAASYAADHPEQLSGLVLLAAYPTASLQEADFPALTVYGSNDGVVNRQRIAEGLAFMPSQHRELVIEGGNHAQFGNYGSQAGDGMATITPKEQRTQTVDAIVEMAAE